MISTSKSNKHIKNLLGKNAFEIVQEHTEKRLESQSRNCGFTRKPTTAQNQGRGVGKEI